VESDVEDPTSESVEKFDSLDVIPESKGAGESVLKTDHPPTQSDSEAFT